RPVAFTDLVNEELPALRGVVGQAEERGGVLHVLEERLDDLVEAEPLLQPFVRVPADEVEQGADGPGVEPAGGPAVDVGLELVAGGQSRAITSSRASGGSSPRRGSALSASTARA